MHEVQQYVDSVRQAADSDRESLGFLPYSAYYDQFALKGNILVAVLDSPNNNAQYIGHLLFDSAFPHAKVRQIFVSRTHRGAGVATRLVGHLKKFLTNLQFVAIHARVGEDMLAANRFWQAQGFLTRQVIAGGATRRRMIVVRCCELKAPSLFHAPSPASQHPLGLPFTAMAERPTYLLDLNVLFDLGPRRARRQDVTNIFRAERMRVCDLAISTEIIAELGRNCPPGKTDPMRDFAAIMPTYDVPKGERFTRLVEDLAPIVFPDQVRAGKISDNDRSDLRHLVTVAGHRLRGLITSDETLLRAAPVLQQRYSIEVLSPEQFLLPDSNVVDEEINVTQGDSTLRIETVEEPHEQPVRDLLTRYGVSVSDQQGVWAAAKGQGQACSRYGIWHHHELIAYVVWPTQLRKDTIFANAVLEQEHPTSSDAAKLLLTTVAECLEEQPVAIVRLSFPDQQQQLRSAALSYGYIGSGSDSKQLQKIMVNRLVAAQNWSLITGKLASLCGVRLPPEIPPFRNVGQQLEVSVHGEGRSYLSLLDLESVLAPSLLCLPGRTGVLVPIRRRYAEHLLQHLGQGSLLPKERAKLYRQRHYFSDPRTRATFSSGDLMFFYESEKDGGYGGVVAVARVIRAYIRRQEAIETEDLDASVLNDRELEKIGKSPMKTVTVFDNLNKFERPIPRSVLESLGCGASYQLQSSRRLTGDQVQGILQKAF